MRGGSWSKVDKGTNRLMSRHTLLGQRRRNGIRVELEERTKPLFRNMV